MIMTDPKTIPVFTLNNGDTIPCIGMGTPALTACCLMR